MQNQIELSALLAGAPAIIAGTPPGAAMSLGSDPVFGLIEAHLQAMRDSTVANEAAEALAGCEGEEEELA